LRDLAEKQMFENPLSDRLDAAVEIAKQLKVIEKDA
jgi:hypothetical protein